MRLPLILVLLLPGCAGTGTPSPDERARTVSELANVVAPEEAADVILSDLGARLRDAGHPLSEGQARALWPVLLEHARAEQALLAGLGDGTPAERREALDRLLAAQARTDARVEAVLAPTQVPTYHGVRDAFRARVLAEIDRGR